MSAARLSASRDVAARKAALKTAERKARQRTQRAKAEPTGFRVSYSGARFGRFCWHNLITTKGVRGPLGLEPWQIDIASELLQVEHEAWYELKAGDLTLEPAELWAKLETWMDEAYEQVWGLRIHREGLIGIPKKNGKSTFGSGLALFLLMADDEEGAEVYSTASTKEQAGIVFRQAREMVEASPKLTEQLRLYRNLIEFPPLSAFYKVVSADAGAQEGINPHGVLNDELHAHKTRDLYDTLRSATIYRSQPLLASITTAGKEIAGTICGELYQRGAGSRPRYRNGRVLERPDKQRSFYFRWYEADRKRIRRRRPVKGQPGNLGIVRVEEMKKANPASWITLAKLEEEAAVERPAAILLRYHANQWIAVEQHWLVEGKWDACVSLEPIDPTGPLIVTVDIGLNYDTTAIVYGNPGGPGGRHRIRSLILGVHADPSKPPPPAHVHLDEAPIPLDTIEHEVRKILTGHKGKIVAVGGDPYKFEAQLQHFDQAGIEAVKIDQGNQMVLAAEKAYKAIGERRLEHDADEVLAAHIDNAAARDVGNGRHRLDKRRAKAVMDGAVATAMFVLLAEDEELVSRSRPAVTILS